MLKESKKLMGLFVLLISVFLIHSSAFAQAYTIIENPNNPQFFGSSTYAKNYYKELGYNTYENNPAAACYGLRSCYSVNYYYQNPGYTYVGNYGYSNGNNTNYNNNSYAYSQNQVTYNVSYRYSYNNNNRVTGVHSLPPAYWSR